MEVNENKIGNFSVINLSGRLDTSNFEELEKKLFDIIDNGKIEILVNCSGLIYISSSGLRVLLIALKKIKSVGGKFYLCCLQENIREIFEIAGFTSIFSIFDTFEEAVQ